MSDTVNSNQLFRPEKGLGNIALNFRNRPLDEFGAYAQAFHEAAQTLALKFINANGHRDPDACPIFFLYRHAAELYFKGIAITGTRIIRLDEPEFESPKTLLKKHSLSLFIPIIAKTFKTVEWKWEVDYDGLRNFDELEAFIKAIEEVDPASFTFRYPVNKDGNAVVPHHFLVNVPIFCEGMEALLDALAAADMGLSVELEQRLEYLAEMQSYYEDPIDDSISQYDYYDE